MKRGSFILSVGFAWVSLTLSVKAAVANGKAEKLPNIVFILLDDFGVKDLGCYGSTFHESPNLDSLAKQGMRFTNAYASHPVCGPSRSAIISGRYPCRLGVTNIGGSVANAGKPWPKALKEAGYATFFAGKWHMGDPNSVLASGFDVNITGSMNGQPSSYYYPYKCEKNGKSHRNDVLGLNDGKPGDYLTDKLTDKALAFIEKNKETPFLLYMSYYQTHKPTVARAQGKKEYVDYFKEKLKSMPEPHGPTTRKVVHGSSATVECLVQRNPEFAGQIKAVDENIGRIMKTLDNLKLAENTIIIFTSDQGSVCTTEKLMVSSQTPYQLGKSWLFDGGLRVPFIVRWPGHVPANKVNDAVTISTDIYPTVLEMLGLPLDPKQHLDGQSIASVLTKGGASPANRTFYWVYNYAHPLGNKPSVAIRKGDYKLIYWLEGKHTELYNLKDDIGETKDLSEAKPEIKKDLMVELSRPDFMKRYLDAKGTPKSGKSSDDEE
jgi:arylsulfatase A-like enzyme